MSESKQPHHDRYDVSGNIEAQYVDAEQTVLVNKLGITELEPLQLAEEEALAKAYDTLLAEVRTDTPLTCDLVRHVHARIFGELYAWAGRYRTVTISKPGITWPPPTYIDEHMQRFERDVLAKHPPAALTSDELFCRAVAEIQGEFLVIHPFREGNARTIKLVTNLLSVQTNRPLLLYDQSEAGGQAYIAAAGLAFRRDYQPMTAIIRQALKTARR